MSESKSVFKGLKCDGCGAPSVCVDSEGVPLCRACADASRVGDCGCGRKDVALMDDGLGGWQCEACENDDSHRAAAESPSPAELLDSADSVGQCRNCGVLTSCVGERGQLQCRDCGGADPDATPEANTSDDGPYADAAFGSPPGTSVPTPAATEPEDFTTGGGLA